MLSRSDKGRAFAGAVLDAATAIDRQGRISVSRIALAGAIVELRFASPVLERLFMPSFGHLQPGRIQAVNGSPDLVVTLWDRAAGQDPPPLPWTPDEYRACGEVAGYSEGKRYVHIDIPMSALTVLDHQNGTAAYWNRRPDALPSYEFAGPLRTLIHRWSIERGMALVHAGAVSLDNAAALIVGDKGAGKTTTTLACVAAGFSYIGDDRCLVSNADIPQVYRVYSCAKVFIDEIDRFHISGLRDVALPPVTRDDKKALLYMDRVLPHRMGTGATLKCIILPKPVSGRSSRLVRMPSTTALRLLIADIVGRSPSTAAQSLELLRSICAKLPFYRLEAGADYEKTAETMADAIGH